MYSERSWGGFLLNKKLFTWSSLAFLMIALTACGSNQGANGDDSPMPIGYFSNEQHEESGGNARWLNEDNDGPVTEMMDHSLGGEGKNEASQEDETEFSRTDRNYHGHLNENNGGARSSYFTAYEGQLAKDLSERAESVVNVATARAIIHGDKVMIGAVMEDRNREEETKTAIKDAVEELLQGRKLYIDTKEGNYSRIKTLDNNLREGSPKEEIDREIKNMFQSYQFHNYIN